MPRLLGSLMAAALCGMDTDTFSGWVEAYPTKHETAQTVAKKLLEDILPRGLQRAHEDIWPRHRAIYDAGPTPTPHQYRPGDWVYVKRHHRETLEPRWKGPYNVVLTTPTALKVDGIATWVHHTHIRPADPSSIGKDFVTQWAVNQDQHNPLEVKLQHIRPT
uniref:Murine leukemia virus integrase C-terminal domain-containing protein n=1 Tax=Felis catus TaxID=9685 RepID=A0ABI7W353_FELCA